LKRRGSLGRARDEDVIEGPLLLVLDQRRGEQHEKNEADSKQQRPQERETLADS